MRNDHEPIHVARLRHINAADSNRGVSAGERIFLYLTSRRGQVDHALAGARASRFLLWSFVILKKSGLAPKLDQFICLFWRLAQMGQCLGRFTFELKCRGLPVAAGASSGVLSLGVRRAEVIGWRKKTWQRLRRCLYPARMRVGSDCGGCFALELCGVEDGGVQLPPSVLWHLGKWGCCCGSEPF